MLVHLENLDVEAKNILKKLEPGDVLALSGNLAAGKTTLTNALLRAMGYEGRVTSPTFVLEKHYPVRYKDFREVTHLDFYRLNPGELSSFGWQEHLGGKNSLTVIEWPERAKLHLPKNVKKITMEIIDDETRRLTFSKNFAH